MGKGLQCPGCSLGRESCARGSRRRRLGSNEKLSYRLRLLSRGALSGAQFSGQAESLQKITGELYEGGPLLRPAVVSCRDTSSWTACVGKRFRATLAKAIRD